MRDTHDVYAETNPAFCAAVLVEFTKAYMSERPRGPEAPVAYLALLVALSGELVGAFKKPIKEPDCRSGWSAALRCRSGLPSASTLRSTS